MGELIVFMVASLDGFVSGPQGELDWELRDPEVGRALVPDLQARVGTMLLGRVLFEGFHQAWPAMAADPASPKELVEFAHWIESTPKVVFSTTLGSVGWTNSTLVRVRGDDDIRGEILRLKRSEPKDLVAFGGARFAQTVTRLGLVDEFRLKVQPVALGRGSPLFAGIAERAHFKLVATKPFASGVVALTYRRA